MGLGGAGRAHQIESLVVLACPRGHRPGSIKDELASTLKAGQTLLVLEAQIMVPHATKGCDHFSG
jgi:hypothetical protein